MSRSASHAIVLTLLAWTSWNCANQREPEGGPVDLIPPEIVSTSPPANAVNVREGRIVVEFDEYVDQRSFEESVFISPPVGTPEFEWDGTTVEITITDSLRPNTTYVVNIGTDVQDRRNRNRLAQAYVLAFSTGAAIDQGSITGQIVPRIDSDQLSGVMVFAYRLPEGSPDSLNPRATPPDYTTQTGKDGAFVFRHLSFGAYRLVAVRDEYRNLLYDPEADDFGVPSRPIVLTQADTLTGGLIMRLAREDTTAPRLIRVDAVDRNHVAVQFSETMQWDGMIPGSFSIRDTATNVPLAVMSVSGIPPSQAMFVLLTATQESTAVYRMVVSGAKDSSGLPAVPPANSLRFNGSPLPDTIRTRLLSTSMKDSLRKVPLIPEIQLRFSDVISRTIPANTFQLRTASGNAVPLNLEWVDGQSAKLTPASALAGPAWYTLTYVLEQVRDWDGRPLKDSTRTFAFETTDPEEFASIEGDVIGWNAPAPGAKLFVTAKALGASPPAALTVRAEQRGHFLFPQVEGGLYVLRAFEDVNGNDRYDAGLPYPFRFSERLGPLSDTLKVRSRWPLDGVRVRF